MRRCLIVANQTLTGERLLAEVLFRQANDDWEFHLLVPATRQHGSTTWTEGQALAHARDALDQALLRFTAEGIDATGEVGDENPVLAVGDVINRQPVDEIIISTLPPGVSRWLKRDLPHRIERRFEIPVTHVTAAPAAV
jgi:hypothetical protein